jgi:hypothetical protein
MDGVTSLILNPPYPNLILLLKIAVFVISAVLVGMMVFALSRTHWLQWVFFQDVVEIFTYKPFGTKKVLKQWLKIKGRLDTGLESEFKLAVIEADAMIDDILTKLGYAGETLGERLTQVSPNILPSVNDVAQAHKVRNNIVHDPDYRLTLEEANNAISLYEKALADLDML